MCRSISVAVCFLLLGVGSAIRHSVNTGAAAEGAVVEDVAAPVSREAATAVREHHR